MNQHSHFLSFNNSTPVHKGECLPEFERYPCSVLSHEGNPGGGSLDGKENPGGVGP